MTHSVAPNVVNLPLYHAEAKERQEAAGSRGNEGGRGNKKPETLPAKTQEGFSSLPKKARGRAENESSYQAAKAAGVGAAMTYQKLGRATNVE